MSNRIITKPAPQKEPSVARILLEMLAIGAAGIGGIIIVFALICKFG